MPVIHQLAARYLDVFPYDFAQTNQQIKILHKKGTTNQLQVPNSNDHGKFSKKTFDMIQHSEEWSSDHLLQES